MYVLIITFYANIIITSCILEVSKELQGGIILEYRVVLIQKQINNTEEIIDLFKNTHIDLVIVADADKLTDVLSQNNDMIDLIIVAIQKEIGNDFDIITKLRTKYKYKDIPFVVLAPKSDVMKGVAMGACDYMILPYNPLDLCSQVKTLLHNLKQDRSVYRSQTEVAMSFHEYFNSEINRADRGNYELSIILFSIGASTASDGIVSDPLLKATNHLSSIIKNKLRSTDTIIRYNPYNIIGFLPFTSKFNAEIVAIKVQDIYEQFTHQNPLENQLNLSYAIVSFPEDGENIEDLLYNAEFNLHLYRKANS